MDMQMSIFKRGNMLKRASLFLISCFLCGCQAMMDNNGQKIFYWERPNTGVVWFAKDHRECMQEADIFPFEWPHIPLVSEMPK